MTRIVHELKCHAALFDAVAAGRKTFEIRRNDRLFQAGDLISLRRMIPADDDMPAYSDEWRPDAQAGPIVKRIGWILPGGRYGLNQDYVAFSLEDDESHSATDSQPTDLSGADQRRIDDLVDTARALGRQSALNEMYAFAFDHVNYGDARQTMLDHLLDLGACPPIKD